MKKLMGLVLAVLASFVLSGCGESNRYYDDYYIPEVTYFLQTYDVEYDEYVGVGGVYYECGPDIVGYTDGNGAFTMIEGDFCTFYDLDYTLSYEYDMLYIGATAYGDVAVGDIGYGCESGWNGITDMDGMFIFDPDYINQVRDGDICGFDF